MLTDAELLLGLGRHLSSYTISPAHAALASLHFGGQVYELAWRLRGSQVSSAERVSAIGVESRIGARQLQRDVLPTMEQLDWVSLQRDDEGQLVAVECNSYRPAANSSKRHPDSSTYSWFPPWSARRCPFFEQRLANRWVVSRRSTWRLNTATRTQKQP